MGLIIFLRHGQAQNNTSRVLAGRASGVPLTEKGINQANDIGKFLKSFDISHIYASPIERAHKTAEIVGEHIGLPTTVDERLYELEMGKFSGMAYDDLFAKHGNVFLKFYQGDPTIEENVVEIFDQVKKRVLDIVDHVRKEHTVKNVLLVTHMDPIKAMISNVLNLNARSLFELIIANASLTVIRDEQSKFSLTAINAMNPDRYNQGPF
ncbi:MAG: histidine phosphatase family protein [Thaumarchaeota archaeon]|nr:histidine phosphatase family protein [Nitrososphaerota archaeon]